MMAFLGKIARPFALVWCILMIAGPLASAQAQPCPLLTPPSAFFPSVTANSSSSDTAILARISTQLDATIAYVMGGAAITKYAVSVVHGQRTIYTAGLTTTPFRIGSITKVFTALGALLLREKCLLSLDDPVKKFLPDFSVANPYEPHEITLRELMGHVSGLPRELCAIPCAWNDSEALAAISKMQLVRPPWSREPAYSNVGFALLAHAWEKATPQKSWDAFVVENITKPLGMTNTGVDLTNVTLAIDNPPGSRVDLGWAGPGGQMYSTADDLAEFLKFLVNATPPLISGASMREWTRSATIFADRQGGFGLPWELIPANFTRELLISKSGTVITPNNVFMAIIAIHPPTQVGVSVLLALDNSSLFDGLLPQFLATQMLEIVGPAVEAVNEEIIETYYAGHFACEPTSPVYNPSVNTTFQILGDSYISISGSPEAGLTAFVNISLLQDGQPGQLVGTYGMLLKNSTENSFWIGDNINCETFFFGISSGPTGTVFNTPGSVDSYEIRFDLHKNTVKWPILGASCAKQ